MNHSPASAPDVAIRRGRDEVIYLQDRRSPGPWPRRLTDRLDYWAEHAPDRPFLVERNAAGAWIALTYAETLRRVRGLAQALVNRRLSADRPVMILSGNSAEHALLALAAMYAGVLYAPVSPAYSLQSRDHRALTTIVEMMRPGLVFAADAAAYDRALAHFGPDVEIATSTAPSASARAV